ncbi:MAG: hypothetical protein PF487_04745 [Bacteroidales bacterium]|jgi:hypothetical protein|nr:hypothetical protein [Bacteroidales bacterium]
MDEKHKNISIGFQLRKITTEQFAVIPDAFNKNNSKIEMSIGLKFGLDKEHKIIASFVKVQFEQCKKTFIIIEIANHFNIEENAWSSFNKTKTGLIIPKGFASHLVMLTIGTLRGTLHCKTENTEFNSFILPTINITELIKNDVELN